MSIYLDAIKVLEERGWYQGDYQGPDGSVCLLGALKVAGGGSAKGLWSEAGRVYRPWRVLKARLGRDVAAFNDDPATSYEDVVLALKRAHEEAA